MKYIKDERWLICYVIEIIDVVDVVGDLDVVVVGFVVDFGVDDWI